MSPPNNADSFWNRLTVTATCWVWIGAIDRGGYGKLHFAGKLKKAHRLAYELSTGEIAAGLLVLHRCDVRRCCNPAHLFLGTNVENIEDMIAKGRARGNAVFLRGKTPQRNA